MDLFCRNICADVTFPPSSRLDGERCLLSFLDKDVPFFFFANVCALNLGIVLNEERNNKFFEENQTDSLLQTHFKMTQHVMKLKMTSGLLREISFIAITWNPKSNCTCRKKNHFLFRRSTSTLPETLIHHLM